MPSQTRWLAMRCSSAISTRTFFTRSGMRFSIPISRSVDEDEGERVRLRGEIVRPLDERNDLLPLLLLRRLLDARVEVADRRVGTQIVSPESCSTRRSTPCVLGCCGPMLTVIVSLRSSGMVAVCAWSRARRAVTDSSLQSVAHDVQQRPMDLLHAGGVRGHVHVNLGACPTRPPSRPVSAIVRSPRARAACSAASTLADMPLVEIPNATSPGWPSASICRTNTCVNE